MAWIPYQIQVKLQIIKFWHRILSMSNCRLPSLILRWSQQLGVTNWASRTMNMLADLPITHFGQEQFMEEVWDALIETELLQWHQSVNKIPENSESGGRFAIYRIIKYQPSVEPYIKKSISRNQRRIMCMLRCGCLPLAVEVGRYRHPKLPLAQHLCQLYM